MLNILVSQRLIALIFLSFVSCKNHTTLTKFSEIVKTIRVAQHFEKLTTNHQLYLEMAEGTLPEDKFRTFIQQDHLYVDNVFLSFRILAERELDEDLKAFFNETGNQNWESVWQDYYDKFNFSKAKEMVPPTLAYSVHQLQASKNDDISIALSTFLPCYTIWAQMGEIISKKANFSHNPGHKYEKFITLNSAGLDGPVVQKFIKVIDAYYEKVQDPKIRKRMLDAYTLSVQHEYRFAEACYNNGKAEKPGQHPKFTDLYETYLSPSFQDQFVHHELWHEIAGGTLHFDKYAVFIQQDHLYIRAFYKAFKLMGQKEQDPQWKDYLKKNSSTMHSWFQEQYDMYQFAPSYHTEFYTQEYIDHILKTAQYASVPEGLASLYPCYALWTRTGHHMHKSLPAKDKLVLTTAAHPYHSFMNMMDYGSHGNSSLNKMQNLVNGYYERLGDDLITKLAMLLAAERSTLHEVFFANGVYKLTQMEVFDQ